MAIDPEKKKAARRKHYHDHRDEYYYRYMKKKLELREWFNQLKSSLKCENCGQDHPAALDFHHINPSDKDNNVGKIFNSSLNKERILLEIEKCKVLCASCHRIHHSNEGSLGKHKKKHEGGWRYERVLAEGPPQKSSRLPKIKDRGCLVDGCTKKHDSHGYCSAHNTSIRRYGKIQAPMMIHDGTQGCTVIKCDGPHYAHGLCSKHYKRSRYIPKKKPKTI
jgi:hypothetical protein